MNYQLNTDRPEFLGGSIIVIFLCFSVNDRASIVNNFFHYLQNFGISIWYDRRNIFLGDNRRQTNINLGAANPRIKYAIVFYSENFVNGKICLDEYKVLTERYDKNEVHIFPIFYKVVPKDIDDNFNLLKQLVYKVCSDEKDFFAITLHIISKITQDELRKNDVLHKNIEDIIEVYENHNDLIYKLLLIYTNIGSTHYEMRMTALFYIYTYLSQDMTINYMHFKTMNYIFYYYKDKIMTDEKRELQIMENIVVLELFNRQMQ